MKFGAVPVGEAESAVLAHSVAVPGGRLRKGRVLTADDLAVLADAGLREVIVARLEAGDLGEDEAAANLADALVAGAAGLRLSVAATGRVNVIADCPGLAAIDATAIHAVNAIDPMVTVATVPPLHRMDAGGLVATIKVISYGVAGQSVGDAILAARGAIGLHRPVVRDVALIETSVGAKISDKGAKALQERLARLGVTYAGRSVVTHDVKPLAAGLRGSNAEVICILTGSATSDMRDTAPEAVRAAGGEVLHFGMPVDPGNLLFIGSMNDRTVIGLPGCARSPALNGADWVLERVLCGVPVTVADIAAMGVGGLLKEIPSRPHPRRAE